MVPLTLHQLFVIWLSCTANYNTFSTLDNAAYIAIDAKIGLGNSHAVAGLVGYIQGLNANPANLGKTPLQAAGDMFDHFATQQGGYVPPSGKTCASIGEILGGI